ncbi:MAG: c-type cytochrome [Candidatus Sericytochromatia bacterium]
MKPADQLKVIALSFFSIVVIIGVITLVSIMTTQAMASHGGGHGAAADHGAAAGDHGAAASGDHGAAAGEHGDAPAESHSDAAKDDHAAPVAKEDEHAAATADKSTPAEHVDATESGAHADAADAPKTEVVKAVGGDIEAGAKVFAAKTCTTCHAVSKVPGAVGAIGPKLDGLGERAATRQPGKDAVTYIKESIENPNGFVTEGYPAAMPALRTTMTDDEFNNLVAFLASL